MTGAEQAEALRGAGWRVLERDGDFNVLPPNADAINGWSAVLKDQDGTMHLVGQRSSLHRQILSALGMNVPKMPEGMQ